MKPAELGCWADCQFYLGTGRVSVDRRRGSQRTRDKRDRHKVETRLWYDKHPMASEVHKFKATPALPWSHDSHHSTACCLSWTMLLATFAKGIALIHFYPFQCSDNADTTPKVIRKELNNFCCCCCCRHSQPTLKSFCNCFLHSAFEFLFFLMHIYLFCM